jgi:hypothetical protein
MKMRNVMLVALIAFLMGIGLWLVGQGAEPAPAKITQAPVPAKAVAPPVAQVEMPKLAAVAPSSSPPAAADSAPPTKPRPEITDAGTIEFTEGVPVTIFCNDGTKCTLTAHAIHMADPEGVGRASNLEQMEIDVALQSPDDGKTQTLRITLLNGKSTRVSTDKTSLDFTAHMNFN